MVLYHSVFYHRIEQHTQHQQSPQTRSAFSAHSFVTYSLATSRLHTRSNQSEMDALAGYGSSDSSDDNSLADKPKSALSGLLANLSDASDADTTTKDDGKESNGPLKKKMRQVRDDDGSPSLLQPQHNMIIPQPQLLAYNDTVFKSTDPFQSLILSTKDYTSQLRQTLSKQLQSQTRTVSEKQNRLAEKLKLLQEKIQHHDVKSQQTSSPNAASSSFASYLKSKHEFGNPHLLKDVIDHFQIKSFDSQQFKLFEYYDRLQVSEERARIAAANFDAGGL